MAGEQDGRDTSNSQDLGDSGEKTKLYAGKYKTVEEMEKGVVELQKKMHADSERYSRLEDKMDSLASRFDEGYGRGQPTREVVEQPADNTRVLTEFYANPSKVLSETRRQAVEEAKAELRKEQEEANKHAKTVEQWTQQNQDVTKYPELLTYWVGQTDARLSPTKRLDEAAKIVRKRVLELRGTPETGEPEPDDVVEGVEDVRATPTRRDPKGKFVATKDPESELASYAASRNKTVRKPLGSIGRK